MVCVILQYSDCCFELLLLRSIWSQIQLRPKHGVVWNDLIALLHICLSIAVLKLESRNSYMDTFCAGVLHSLN